MNRCEELAKKKNPLRSNETLKHSETYMGVEFTEDLTHWKYIKKYKNSKGKTVYVYANKETHSGIQKHINEARKYNQAIKNTEEEIDRDLKRSKSPYDSAATRFLFNMDTRDRFKEREANERYTADMTIAEYSLKSQTSKAIKKAKDFIKGTLNEANDILGRVFKKR